jgi:serine/threonine protein kinase
MKPLQRLEASWLPPGTLVGPWKVKAFQGSGAYGLVFRAVRAAREHGGWVALKMACLPGDQRFEREAVLLSRQDHIGVPKLLGRGEWENPDGARYPYLVMEWLEGVTLYEWADQSKPSNEEQMWVLAQVARALEATHAVGGVHRDVKGDNVRVCFNGRRAVLMDFGAGSYQGATRLTREGLPPGTDTYRSPEACLFELTRPRHSMERYEATPADDVFALGVSAYRMVTGAYPPPAEVREEESGPGRLQWTKPPAPRALNSRVNKKLSALILRMLSERAAERPPAGELAQVLEEAVAELRRARWPEKALDAKRLLHLWERTPTWVRYAACAVLGGVLAATVADWARKPERERGSSLLSPMGDESWMGAGDTGARDPGPPKSKPADQKALAKRLPDEPLEGQRRAPRCVPPDEVTINKGCWIPVRDSTPPCGRLTYEWKGACYAPSYPPPGKEPVSEPP